MRGGSDDLMSATRAPDAGDAGAGNATAAPEMQRGYHGSTSNFDAFDARFVGSGQGDNAQGWGINIDQNRASARRYAGRLGRQNGPGVLYEVEFPQGPFLDAELPLNQQPAEVQALAQQLGYPTTNALVRELRAPSRFNTQRQASEAFRAAGVRGLRYRSSKNIDSHGYLIFDPADARIVTRDGQPVGARAQTDGGRLGAGNARTRPWDAELLLPQERTGIVDRLRGARTYETPNATVRVSPRGDFREVEWDLKDGSASMSLADRARAEAEGINAARDALRQDMAAHPNARYYIEPSTQALFRRYRRIADDLGLTARPVGDGLVLERNAPNARPPPRTPPQRPNR
jgi:hypothetical protein